MQRKLVIALVVLSLGVRAMLVQAAPQWAWFSYPYAYFFGSTGWGYLSEGDTQWTCDMTSGQWSDLAQGNLHSGYAYFSWPYAYDFESGHWFYLNEADQQWVCMLSSGSWQTLQSLVSPDTGLFKISGTVYYSTTPLSGEVVELVNSQSQVVGVTTSGVNGAYSFLNLSNDFYEVGFKTDANYVYSGWGFNVEGADVVQDVWRVKPLTAIAPASGATVHAAQPTFEWSTLPEAVTYNFRLNVNGNPNSVDVRNGLTTNRYTTVATLANGQGCTWHVVALDAQNHQIGRISPSAEFSVVLP